MEAGATGGGGWWRRVIGWAWTYVYCAGKVSLCLGSRCQCGCWRGYVRRVDLAGEHHLGTIVTNQLIEHVVDIDVLNTNSIDR
jgi:hypothetical protein